MSGIADYLPGGPLCPLPKDCTDAEYEAWLQEKWIKRAPISM